MYKLELDDKQINDFIEFHYRNNNLDENINDPDISNYRKQDNEIIRESLKNVNIFYDDDLMGIFEKYYKQNNVFGHHSYRILVTKGKFRIWTEISLPENQLCVEKFSLSSVIQALSFEISDPEDYLEDPEDSTRYKKAVKRFKKNSDKIYDQFGELFYSCILGGSL